MTRPFFTRERISDFEIYHRNCDITLRVAKQRLNEGLSVDFQVTFNKCIYMVSQSLNSSSWTHRIWSLASHWTRLPSSYSETTLGPSWREFHIRPRTNQGLHAHFMTILLPRSSRHSSKDRCSRRCALTIVPSGRYPNSGQMQSNQRGKSWTSLSSHSWRRRWRGTSRKLTEPSNLKLRKRPFLGISSGILKTRPF